jgi:hypothetical protein
MKKFQIKKIFCTSLCVFTASNFAFAAPRKRGSTTGNKPSTEEQTSTVIEINDKSTDEAEKNEARPIERLFKNPVFASGISSGADAINHSIDSLMESLFYGMLDNKIAWPLTGSSSINLNATRDVFSARSGAYVVVDRLGIGPSYSRELYRYNDIPVTLGAHQSSDVYDIHLRTDPMRVNENRTLSWWRVAVNNWFGVLPILEAVLPPSFNANEMYDPLNRVQSPFTFPLSIESAKSMDIGSIKSYAISGGVNLGIDTAQGMHGFKDQVFTGPNSLDFKLPLSVFRTGEYRINVLKKDTNAVWVGLSDMNRLGQRIETKLGKTYYLLSKTIPLWKGMPAPIFPIDFAIEEAIGDLFSHVYAFDLRNSEAQSAYLEAVHGNFAAAHVSWLRAREDKLDTGVVYFYTKKERRFETSVATGHNVFVKNKRTNRTHSDAEIEITDDTDKYYILEAKEDSDRGQWDMLTGRAEEKISLQADLLVRKVVEKENTENSLKSRYEFVATENPIDLSFSLSITDKFVETEDLAEYLAELRQFTMLATNGVPRFDVREPDLLAKRRRAAYFLQDQGPEQLLHVTPTHLGRFEGYASIKLTNDQLSEIAGKPRGELWLAFCKAFGVTKAKTCSKWEQSLLTRNFYRITSLFSKPMRLVDYKWKTADTVNEVEESIAALKKFNKFKSPEQRQAALREFFATEYPIERVHALLSLLDLSQVPRSIELESQPKGNASDSVKDRFRKINGLRFSGEAAFPPPARYDSNKAIESKFDPANLAFTGSKPVIKKISLYRDDVDERAQKFKAKNKRMKDSDSEHPILIVKLGISKLKSPEFVHVYAKLEQAGKVQLAKLKLFEDVIDIPIANDLDFAGPDRVNVQVRLSGPQSVLANMISEDSLSSGGEFRLTVAASGNSLLWSDEKTLEFRLLNGRLTTK